MKPGPLSLLIVGLLAVGCSGAEGAGEEEPGPPATTAIPAVALAEPVVGGDLELKMQPGDGPGEQAEQFVAHLGLLWEAEEGTANHVASFDGRNGALDVVTWIGGANPPGNCARIFERNSPSTIPYCSLDWDEPLWFTIGAGVAYAYGTTSGAEAVFWTESENTVSVLTVGGWALAEWPPWWGPPRTIEFYDTDGSLVASVQVPSPVGE